MKNIRSYLPSAVVILLTGAALWYGPVAQLPAYHDFADQTARHGIPHFADVVSNAGFALVALWGLWTLAPSGRDDVMANGWAGYRLFLVGLLLTAFGSSYYHLAPDNATLVWDRLPITLTCGGLLAGVWGDCKEKPSTVLTAWLALAGGYSVLWWHVTEQTGSDDLRAYLMFQILPMLLIPLWQWIHRAPLTERLSFGGALVVYAIAKFAELYDHEIATSFGLLTGHTLKHLLATLAAALIVGRLAWRVRKANTINAANATAQ